MPKSKIVQLMKDGDLDEALVLLQNKNSDLDPVMTLVFKSKVFEKKGNINKSLKFSQMAIEEAEDGSDILLKIEAYLASCNNLSRVGKIELGLDHAEKCLDLFNQLPPNQAELIENLKIKSKIFLSLGLLYDMKGQLNKAMEYYQLILQADYQIEDDIFAFVYNNIGELHRISGNFEVAQDYYQKSLKIRERQLDYRGIAVCHVNLGIIADRMGNQTTGQQHFKYAYEMFVDLHNDSDTAEAIYHYALSLFDTGSEENYDLAEELVDELHLLEIKTQNQRVTILYKILKAIYLKSKGRSKYFAQAQSLLEEVQKISDIDFEFKIFALLNLAELLFIEYQMIHTEEVYEDLFSIVVEIYQKAQDQQSYSLLVQSLIIQSKLAFIRNELKKSLLILDQAEIIAEERSLSKLAKEVKKIRSDHKDKLVEMNRIMSQNSDIKQMIEATELSSYLSDMVKLFK